jgi:hypothetical protein
MEREHMLRAQADHREIVGAVERGDPDGAGHLAARHRDSNLAAWRRIIERATRADGQAGRRGDAGRRRTRGARRPDDVEGS